MLRWQRIPRLTRSSIYLRGTSTQTSQVMATQSSSKILCQEMLCHHHDFRTLISLNHHLIMCRTRTRISQQPDNPPKVTIQPRFLSQTETITNLVVRQIIVIAKAIRISPILSILVMGRTNRLHKVAAMGQHSRTTVNGKSSLQVTVSRLR